MEPSLPPFRLYDMHCHIDFQEDPAAFLREGTERSLAFLSCTVEPDGYAQAQSWAKGSNVALGLGAHPWWVAEDRISKEGYESLCEEIAEAPFIGEIGIDLSPKHVDLATKDHQIEVFRAICIRAADTGGKVLSIHSVKSADIVLDILEETGCLDPAKDMACILHWFSGSTPELWRAIHAGCYFSVGEPFCRTRHAKEYLKLIPKDHLLLETDYPPEHAGFAVADYERALRSAATLIAASWHTSPEDAATTLASTSAPLFMQARA